MLDLIGKITIRSPTTVIGRRLKPLDVRTDPRAPSSQIRWFSEPGGEIFKKKILSTTPSVPILCFFYNFAHELKDNKN
jgi:hypothetical protein